MESAELSPEKASVAVAVAVEGVVSGVEGVVSEALVAVAADGAEEVVVVLLGVVDGVDGVAVVEVDGVVAVGDLTTAEDAGGIEAGGEAAREWDGHGGGIGGMTRTIM